MNAGIEQRATELRNIGSAIVQALARIVNAPQTDEQFDANVIPRSFVIDQALLIKEQYDKILPIAAALQAQQPGAQAVVELRDDATEFQAPAEGFTCFHCGTHFASTPKGIRAAREHFGERPSAPPDCVVVPKALPFEVLGEAAIAGVFETGNPKHGWDYLLSKVGRPCTHSQPPSIPEPSEADAAKALSYYRSGLEHRDPDYVPARVRLANVVTGDGPFRSTCALPGDHDCECNSHGAVSVRATNGKMLGIKPAEFDVIAWRSNDRARLRESRK